MLDLLLINPPTPGLVRPDAHAALSLMYVAGAARDAGDDVRSFLGFMDSIGKLHHG